MHTFADSVLLHPVKATTIVETHGRLSSSGQTSSFFRQIGVSFDETLLPNHIVLGFHCAKGVSRSTFGRSGFNAIFGAIGNMRTVLTSTVPFASWTEGGSAGIGLVLQEP